MVWTSRSDDQLATAVLSRADIAATGPTRRNGRPANIVSGLSAIRFQNRDADKVLYLLVAKTQELAGDLPCILPLAGCRTGGLGRKVLSGVAVAFHEDRVEA